MMINVAGRQRASSAGALVSTESVSKAYELAQTQLVGAFCVMPALLPGQPGSHQPGDVRYGVSPEMALDMARRAVDEVRVRNASQPLHIQLAVVEELVEERKKVSIMVRLVTRLTTLMSIDQSVGCMVFRHDELQKKIRFLV
jgi:hypothetical protein